VSADPSRGDRSHPFGAHQARVVVPSFVQLAERARMMAAELEELAARVLDDVAPPAARTKAAACIEAHWCARLRLALERDTRALAPEALPPVRAAFVRLAVASKSTGVPTRTLRRWCESGLLQGTKRGGSFWYVRVDTIAKLGVTKIPARR
jgi:hypothetical protein